MTIEEALAQLSIFQNPQPPPDKLMMWHLGLLPDHCPHGVKQTHTCLRCKAEKMEEEAA